MGHKSGSISKRYIHAYDDDVKNCAHVMSTILKPVWVKKWANAADLTPKTPGVRKEKTRKT